MARGTCLSANAARSERALTWNPVIEAYVEDRPVGERLRPLQTAYHEMFDGDLNEITEKPGPRPSTQPAGRVDSTANRSQRANTQPQGRNLTSQRFNLHQHTNQLARPEYVAFDFAPDLQIVNPSSSHLGGSHYQHYPLSASCTASSFRVGDHLQIRATTVSDTVPNEDRLDYNGPRKSRSYSLEDRGSSPIVVISPGQVPHAPTARQTLLETQPASALPEVLRVRMPEPRPQSEPQVPMLLRTPQEAFNVRMQRAVTPWQPLYIHSRHNNMETGVRGYLEQITCPPMSQTGNVRNHLQEPASWGLDRDVSVSFSGNHDDGEVKNWQCSVHGSQVKLGAPSPKRLPSPGPHEGRSLQLPDRPSEVQRPASRSAERLRIQHYQTVSPTKITIDNRDRASSPISV